MNSDPCPHHLSQPKHRDGLSPCQGSLSHLPVSRPALKPSFVTSGSPQVPSSFTKLRMGKHRSTVSQATSAFPQFLAWIKRSCLVCPSQVAFSIAVYKAISLSLLHRICPGRSPCVWGDPPTARLQAQSPSKACILLPHVPTCTPSPASSSED